MTVGETAAGFATLEVNPAGFDTQLIEGSVTILEDEVRVILEPIQITAGAAVAVTVGAGTTKTTTSYVAVQPAALKV